MKTTATLNLGQGRVLHAEYHGGAYVELTFGGARVPIEVINVWDDDTNCAPPDLVDDPYGENLGHRVQAWVKQTEAEWPEWYEGYLENSRW
jgi:hypothetical protein